MRALLAALALAAAALPPRGPHQHDFGPFVMAIEHRQAVRGSTFDGRTFSGWTVERLEYRSRTDWVSTIVADSHGTGVGEAQVCRDGALLRRDAAGREHRSERHPMRCDGVGRWIHPGLAHHYPWRREVHGDTIVLTDPGERVVFDRRTGLPLRYEIGDVAAGRADVTTFRVEGLPARR